MDVILFLIFAAIALVAAVNVVVQSHPISSAISLIGVMGSLAVLYLLLGAEFIAAAQVIVYAGAVMVLQSKSETAHLLGVPALVVFALLLVYFIHQQPESGVHFGGFTGGSAQAVGRALFTTYLLPFEVTSVLILIAIIGAIVLARKEI
jgi:NADH-quinone oxidoreductase subunit J